jgi:hypothetical protein
MPMALRKSDRLFLCNIRDLSYMNRAVAITALKNAGAKCDEAAIILHINVEKLSEEKAKEMAQKRGTAPLLLQAMAAKIFAEAVGGFEDLGSLCEAIRQRKNQSIFVCYGNSEQLHVDFFREVFNEMQCSLDLATYLNLPGPTELKNKLSPEEISLIEEQYDICFTQIKSFADLFLRPGEELPNDPDPRQNVFVVNEIREVGGKPNKRGIMVRTQNKIKHRFLVFSDPKALFQALQEDGFNLDIETTPIELKQEQIDIYRTIGFGCSKCMERLAALLIGLDDKGIELM